jgi:hypothetical protein
MIRRLWKHFRRHTVATEEKNPERFRPRPVYKTDSAPINPGSLDGKVEDKFNQLPRCTMLPRTDNISNGLAKIYRAVNVGETRGRQEVLTVEAWEELKAARRGTLGTFVAERLSRQWLSDMAVDMGLVWGHIEGLFFLNSKQRIAD